MKTSVVVLAVAFCVALVSSHPLPEEERLQSEALDRLVMVESDNEAAMRSKRTIGILRELFPDVSQMIEQKVNAIVAEIIRALGPTVLRNFLGNGGAGSGRTGGSSGDGSTATAASPFDDDDDDVDEDEAGDSINSTSANGSRVSISLPTFPPDDDEESGTTTTESSSAGETTTRTDQSAEGTSVSSPTVE